MSVDNGADHGTGVDCGVQMLRSQCDDAFMIVLQYCLSDQINVKEKN